MQVRTTPGALVLASLLLALGCASPAPTLDAPEAGAGFRGGGGAPAPERKIVRSGDQVVVVESPEDVAPEVPRIVEAAGGFVERSTIARDEDVEFRCRVPAARLDEVMDAIAALGEEAERSVSAADVTERALDLEGRIRSKKALRDRMQALLARASDLDDVLKIEREISRLQAEIETLQGRLDRLESQVAMSALSVELRRPEPTRILGPLGYLAYGLWWGISKLFIIR